MWPEVIKISQKILKSLLRCAEYEEGRTFLETGSTLEQEMTAVAALRDQWQADRTQRQQAVAERRQVVQADLAQIKQQREAKAYRTAAMLDDFDAELRDTVANMRAQNRQKMKATKKYVAELQEVTHQELTQHRQERAVMQEHQRKKLSKYVDELEDCVSEYLSDVSEKRQAVAVQDRAKRQRDRANLTDQVQALRDDYSAYGQEMKAFREDLRQSVWGESSPASVNGNGNGAGTFHPSASSNAQGTETSKVDILAQRAVYEHLKSHRAGARLADIETTLGLNRFQAVDALQALMQRGIIVQKDRTYLIREEALL